MKKMTTKDVQDMSLDILKDIHEFCVKNNIKYTLGGGSLLGAIRHNGFIPWDDDIDIYIPRPDYDRFINTYTSNKGYKVCSPELARFKQNIWWSYARVFDTKKTFVDTGTRPWISEETGVWIDVFPCDGITANYTEAEAHLNSICKLTKRARWIGVAKVPLSNIIKAKNFLEAIRFGVKKILTTLLSINVNMDIIIALRKKYDYEDSDYFFVDTHYGMGEWLPKKNIECFELHDFEDSQFYIMSGYDATLKSFYGDYMTMPPENKRVVHNHNKYFWK